MVFENGVLKWGASAHLIIGGTTFPPVIKFCHQSVFGVSSAVAVWFAHARAAQRGN